MSDNVTSETGLTAESLINDLRRLRGACCSACKRPLCHHAALMNIALGFKDAVRCLSCLASALGSPTAGLREQLFDYIQRRDCFRGAWDWACHDENVAASGIPPCLDDRTFSPATEQGAAPVTPSAPKAVLAVADASLAADAEWDAGDMGCGELVPELRLRLQAMAPGQIFRLCARDAGAPEHLPAWCRLTGHRLLRAEPPTYWIQRKR